MRQTHYQVLLIVDNLSEGLLNSRCTDAKIVSLILNTY